MKQTDQTPKSSICIATQLVSDMGQRVFSVTGPAQKLEEKSVSHVFRGNPEGAHTTGMDINPSDPALTPFYRELARCNLPLLTHTGHERAFRHADNRLGVGPKIFRRSWELLIGSRQGPSTAV